MNKRFFFISLIQVTAVHAAWQHPARKQAPAARIPAHHAIHHALIDQQKQQQQKQQQGAGGEAGRKSSIYYIHTAPDRQNGYKRFFNPFLLPVEGQERWVVFGGGLNVYGQR